MTVPTSPEFQGCSFLTTLPSTTFSPDQFTAEEQLMIDSAEAFSRNEVIPLVERLDHQEPDLMPNLIRKAGELGFCGPDTPEAFGGLGLSKNLAARMLEYLSLNGSFSVTIGITSGISQIGLILFGTDEQKARFLPELAEGTKIGAYALSEPNSGSDALSLTTKAVHSADGYQLTGTKMWISNAKWAETFLVLAKIDGTRTTAFLVDRNTPGVSIAREEMKLGLKGSSTARLILDEARIPNSNRLHEEGLGHQVAFNALNIGRLKLASMSLGPARDAIGLAARYSNERMQFGHPISSFGLIQKKFATMAALYYAAESMTYRTGNLVDGAFSQCDGSIDGNRRAAEEFAVECSMCKVFATEAEALIVDEALQCFGGYGFTEEFPIARHYRDARVSRIYEGTNEINRVFIADRIRRKFDANVIATGLPDRSFLATLLQKAMLVPREHQAQDGALADLLILYFAEQSTRLRAGRVGGIGTLAHQLFTSYANVRAAEAFQTITGEAIELPCSQAGISAISALATAIYDLNGPLR